MTIAGIAKITMNDWISSDQMYRGILLSDMPGARILTMVTIRLTPDSNVPTPAICSDQM